MTEIVVVSGNPRPGSRTLGLATSVGVALAERLGLPQPSIVDVGALGPGLLSPEDPATAAAVAALTAARWLVVATPTYKGTFTGVLKVLLDRLPAAALAGRTAVPVVTAGVQPQADAAAGYLAALLRELGADVADPALTVVEADLAEAPARVKEYVQRLAG